MQNNLERIFLERLTRMDGSAESAARAIMDVIAAATEFTDTGRIEFFLALVCVTVLKLGSQSNALANEIAPPLIALSQIVDDIAKGDKNTQDKKVWERANSLCVEITKILSSHEIESDRPQNN